MSGSKKKLITLIILNLALSMMFLLNCSSTLPMHREAISRLENSRNYSSDLKDLISKTFSDSIIVGNKAKGDLNSNDNIIKLNVLPAKSYCDIYKLNLPAKRIKISINSIVEGGYAFMPRLILIDSSFTIISSRLDFVKYREDLFPFTGCQLTGEKIMEIGKTGQYYLVVCSDNDKLSQATPYRFDILQAATGSYQIKCSIQ